MADNSRQIEMGINPLPRWQPSIDPDPLHRIADGIADENETMLEMISVFNDLLRQLARDGGRVIAIDGICQSHDPDGETITVLKVVWQEGRKGAFAVRRSEFAYPSLDYNGEYCI